MAKKKSKRFIIPSIHFLTTHPVEKMQEPVSQNQGIPDPPPPAALKTPAENIKSDCDGLIALPSANQYENFEGFK